jgi:5-methylcytosine-specific restriction endonuclease McrA
VAKLFGLLMALAVCIALPADARDRTQVTKFRTANPCPSTQRIKGACPGWEVDHVKPLHCGGADIPANMQWLSVKDHKKKTAKERRDKCRAYR